MTPSKVRAAIYARVSTRDQSVALQVDEAERFCRARGWEIVATIQDTISGIRERRPGLDFLMSLARGRRIDAVVVWKRDRLFRSLRHLLASSAELEALGVAFVSLTEQIDTTTPAGKLLVSILASLAEFERDILIERTRAGMAAAKRQGVRIGRPRVFVDLARAGKLLRKGWSMRQIAKKLRIGLGTLQRALAREKDRTAG